MQCENSIRLHGEMVLVRVKPMIRVVVLKYSLIGVISSEWNHSIFNYSSLWVCSGRTVWETLSFEEICIQEAALAIFTHEVNVDILISVLDRK